MIAKPSVTCPRISFLLMLMLFSPGFFGAPLHGRQQQSTNLSPPQEAPQKDLATLKKELSTTEGRKGKDHPDLIPILTELAKASRDQGGYIPALPFAQRLLEITRKVRGQNHVETAGALDFLATLYRLQGDNQSALENYQRALPIAEKKLGTDHPAYATLLTNLAQVYMATGKTAEAESALQTALKVKSDYYGAAAPEATGVQMALGELYLRTGSFAKAEQLLIYALTIRSEGLGIPVQAGKTTEPEVLFYMAPIRNLLGRLYAVVGLYDRAEPLLQDALKAMEAQLGGEHPLLEDVLLNLAALSQATGETAKADGYQKRAEQIHEKNAGFSHVAGSPLPKPLEAVLPSRNGLRPYADARVGDWVIYERQGIPAAKKEIVRKTPVVAIVLTYQWEPQKKEWLRGVEQLVDLSADLKGDI